MGMNLARMSFLVALGTIIGCDSGHSGSPAAPVAKREQGAQAAAEAAGDRYVIDVELPDRTRPGHEALAKVHVRGLGDWHLNTEFPAKLRLRASNDVSLVMPEQTRHDAERLDDTILTFAVPFTSPTAGSKHFEGQLSFAMCSAAACDPEVVPVDFTLEVQACDAAVPC
jgi:hypothetical protein